MSAACGGKSVPERPQGLDGSSGGAGRVTGGTGADVTNGCTYEGVHYELGESFGPCNLCECDAWHGGVSCRLLPCESGGTSAGGTGATSSGGEASGGRAGTPALGGAGTGANAGTSGGGTTGGGANAGSGANAGGAGTGGNTGGASGSNSGEAGQGGTANECTLTPVTTVCLVGTRREDQEELDVGDQLKLLVRASGCHSSSCTELVETYCNYLTDNRTIYLTSYLCIASTGDGACTDDCGGVGSVECEPGLELEEGDYTLTFGSATLRFSVPSVIPPNGICASSEDD